MKIENRFFGNSEKEIFLNNFEVEIIVKCKNCGTEANVSFSPEYGHNEYYCGTKIACSCPICEKYDNITLDKLFED